MQSPTLIATEFNTHGEVIDQYQLGASPARMDKLFSQDLQRDLRMGLEVVRIGQRSRTDYKLVDGGPARYWTPDQA